MALDKILYSRHDILLVPCRIKQKPASLYIVKRTNKKLPRQGRSLFTGQMGSVLHEKDLDHY
jgi:hypothetical protein